MAEHARENGVIAWLARLLKSAAGMAVGPSHAAATIADMHLCESVGDFLVKKHAHTRVTLCDPCVVKLLTSTWQQVGGLLRLRYGGQDSIDYRGSCRMCVLGWCYSAPDLRVLGKFLQQLCMLRQALEPCGLQVSHCSCPARGKHCRARLHWPGDQQLQQARKETHPLTCGRSSHENVEY